MTPPSWNMVCPPVQERISLISSLGAAWSQSPVFSVCGRPPGPLRCADAEQEQDGWRRKDALICSEIVQEDLRCKPRLLPCWVSLNRLLTLSVLTLLLGSGCQRWHLPHRRVTCVQRKSEWQSLGTVIIGTEQTFSQRG